MGYFTTTASPQAEDAILSTFFARTGTAVMEKVGCTLTMKL
jgi:hypothetical protein